MLSTHCAPALVILVGCDPWMVGVRSGPVTVETCHAGHIAEAAAVHCPGRWRRPAPPSANLATWRPSDVLLRLDVREHHGRYAVALEGVVRCHFDTPITSKVHLNPPPGATCQMANRTLRVGGGWFTGAGGMYAPSYLQVSLLLSDAEGVVRLDGQLHRPR